MSWDTEPRRDEPLTQEIAPYRSRKDRARWCAGHPGREHVVDRLVQRYGSTCRVGYWYRHPRGLQVVAPRWYCVHWWACSRCGRIMTKLDTVRCPDRPTILPPPRQHPYATSR